METFPNLIRDARENNSPINQKVLKNQCCLVRCELDRVIIALDRVIVENKQLTGAIGNLIRYRENGHYIERHMPQLQQMINDYYDTLRKAHMLQIRTMNMWTRCVANALNIPDMLQQMFPTTILSDSHIQTEETLESTKAILEESLEIIISLKTNTKNMRITVQEP